jgi:hypothetical protein
MGLGYRLRQGLGRLKVGLLPSTLDFTPAHAVLSDQLWQLFSTMPRGDQWHGLCVLSRLQTAGWTQPDLLAAALLHDLGKANGRLSLTYRTLIIVASALGARWVPRLASDEPRSWRYPLYVHLHHAALGAAWLQKAGASAALVNLVATHEQAGAPLSPELAAMAQALKAADDAC